MEIRDFKVTAQTEKRIDFTCEGKGRLVDWNWIEGFSSGPQENQTWPAEWVVIIQRGGKEIKRKMKLTERSKAITRAINKELALYVARNGTKIRGPQPGPLENTKDWPASNNGKTKTKPGSRLNKGNSKVARSGSKSSGPQGQTQGQSKKVARTVALTNIHEMDIQPGPHSGPKEDLLDIPEFLRR